MKLTKVKAGNAHTLQKQESKLSTHLLLARQTTTQGTASQMSEMKPSSAAEGELTSPVVQGPKSKAGPRLKHLCDPNLETND